MKNTLGVNLRAKPAVFSREKYHFLGNFYLSHFYGQFIIKSVRAPLMHSFIILCKAVTYDKSDILSYISMRIVVYDMTM